MAIDADRILPLRYTKTSFLDAKIGDFLQSGSAWSGHIEPEYTMNSNGGFIASILQEAEMTGSSAILFKAILDQHVITSESLQAFGPVLKNVLGIDTDLTEVYRMKSFKKVLLEMNAKKNGIYN